VPARITSRTIAGGASVPAGVGEGEEVAEAEGAAVAATVGISDGLIEAAAVAVADVGGSTGGVGSHATSKAPTTTKSAQRIAATPAAG